MADNKKATKAFENLAPLLGLGATLGAQIPGLKKPKRRTDSQSAARQTSMKAAGAAVGASQTGFGASRGLALRSGLRAAANIAREGALGAAAGAAADEAQHQKNMEARNTRLATFGKDVGEMAGQIGTGIVESRAAKEAEAAAAKAAEMQMLQEQAGALIPTYAEQQGIDPITGLPAQAAQQLPQEQQQLQELPVGQGPGLDELDQYGQHESDFIGAPDIGEVSLDPALGELGIADKQTLYSIAPELELQHRLENFALDEAYRTGTNINRIYARLRRLQNLPAINSTIDMNQQLQLQMPQMGGQ
jgi:hypothetical protein